MISIRQEEPRDHPDVFEIIETAFRDVEHSDQSEPYLVIRLRKTVHFLPELSLVALWNERLVGHILLTRVSIDSGSQKYTSLALAPVSVHPDFQSRGIGGQLIKRAHEIAIDLRFESVVLIGHQDYYPRFGYKQASEYGIEFPFDVPEENCMVKELVPGALDNIKGMVRYPPEFTG